MIVRGQRDAADEQRVAAEPLDLEAESLEQLAMLLESIGLLRPEVQREGKQQPLRWHFPAFQRAHEPLEEDPLVRGMLVDENDAILAFEHHVRAAELQEWRHIRLRDGRLRS